jgi:hypothetical protein
MFRRNRDHLRDHMASKQKDNNSLRKWLFFKVKEFYALWTAVIEIRVLQCLDAAVIAFMHEMESAQWCCK